MPPSPIQVQLSQLRDRVRAGAANRPGIYRMLGQGGVVIYVGKSKRVRTRLMGYFRAKRNQKAWRIVRDAASIEWEYVPNEFASLLRELELIKRYRPPYNVRSKRDRIYCFLKVTRETAPRLHVVRTIREDSGRYFGPFQGGRRISDAVRELNDALRLRDCRPSTPMRFSDQADLFGEEPSPLCPRHELLRCSAPCAAKCSAGEYLGRVQTAQAFLNGRSDEPITILEDRLRAAVERMAFEHAAMLHQRIERLMMLRREFERLLDATRALSFLYAVPGHAGEGQIYVIRAGSIRERFPAPSTGRERNSMLAAAARHFENPESVSEISTPQRVEELMLVSHWFRTRPQERARTYRPDHWAGLPLAGEMTSN